LKRYGQLNTMMVGSCGPSLRERMTASRFQYAASSSRQNSNKSQHQRSATTSSFHLSKTKKSTSRKHQGGGKQTVRPAKWIIVDDALMTVLQNIEAACKEFDWIVYLESIATKQESWVLLKSEHSLRE